MRFKYHIIAAIAVAAGASAPAAASDLSYTYVEAGFSQARVDGLGELIGSDNLNGYSATVSYGATNGLILFGGYSTHARDVDFLDSGLAGSLDLGLDAWTVGAGYAYPVGERADWVTRVAYEGLTFDVDANGTYDDGSGAVPFRIAGNADANAWTLETGVRGRLTTRLDGYIGAGYTRLDDPTIENIDVDGESFDAFEVDLNELGADRSEAFGVVGAHVSLGAGWGLVGRARVASDVTQYFVGVRASL